MPASPPPDHRGKFCDFILNPLNSRTGGELMKCQRAAAGYDRNSRGFRCAGHLDRKPHVKRQTPGSRKVKTSHRRPSYLPPIHEHTD